MFGNKLKEPIVLELLSTVLNHRKTMNKKSPFSINGEEKMYNLYSMLILIDAIIKYQIIVKSDTYFETFIHQLEKLTSSYKNHQELVIGINSILGDIIRVELGLSDLVKYENKRKVLEKIYDRYIVNGYCFHSFPSVFKDTVEANGIRPKNYKYPQEVMKQIAHIFKNHRYPNFIPQDLLEKSPKVYLTDSPLMAYYYAISSPTYFCDITSTSPYMKGNQYDTFAYYRKDFKACRKNLEQLGRHVHLSEKEHKIISEAFKKQWQKLQVNTSIPCIAVIERRVVGRNYLPDIDAILKNAKKEDFVISMARITDSRYPDDVLEKTVLSLDFTVDLFPEYKEIELGILKEREEEQAPVVVKAPQEIALVPLQEKKEEPIEKLFSLEEEKALTKQIVKDQKKEKKLLRKKKKEKVLDNKPPLSKPLFQDENTLTLDLDFDEIEDQDEKPVLLNEPVNDHGYADVFALGGLLCIITGLTLILIFRYFGIG